MTSKAVPGKIDHDPPRPHHALAIDRKTSEPSNFLPSKTSQGRRCVAACCAPQQCCRQRMRIDMPENKRAQIVVPMQPDLRTAVRAAAEKENRTVANFVRCVLARAVEPQDEARLAS
jgi:hypothetical protein